MSARPLRLVAPGSKWTHAGVVAGGGRRAAVRTMTPATGDPGADVSLAMSFFWACASPGVPRPGIGRPQVTNKLPTGDPATISLFTVWPSTGAHR